jgi:hypothetical protein
MPSDVFGLPSVFSSGVCRKKPPFKRAVTMPVSRTDCPSKGETFFSPCTSPITRSFCAEASETKIKTLKNKMVKIFLMSRNKM